MQASTSILSRYAKRLFTRYRATGSLRRSNPRSRRRRANGPLYVPAEVLEERALLAASLGSVLGVGSTGQDAAYGVTTDTAGNSYMAGTFSGTVNFNPNGTAVTLTSRGSDDAFVAKYAPDNSLVWAQRMGGDVVTTGGATDKGAKVKVDGSGNVYVSGFFSSTSSGADFGSTTLYSAGGTDGFVTKLNASGTFQWAKSWGVSGTDYAPGVGVDSAGNVYALGEVPGSAYTIHKFSSTGAAVWSESIAVNPQLPFADLAVNASGNVFVGGNFQGTVNFSPTGRAYYVSSGPAYSGFVLDLNTSGKFQWVSPFVGQTVGSTGGYSGVFSLALDNSGNIDVGGTYANSVDFDPGPGVTTLPTVIANGSNGFIARLNSSGGLVWARALQEDQSANFVSLYGLAVDTAGSVYGTGSFGGTIDLNPGSGTQIYAAAAGPMFVVKLDALGNFGWGATFGASGGGTAFGIAVDTSGSVHIAGVYRATADFDPDPNNADNMTSAGGTDIFLLQLIQS